MPNSINWPDPAVADLVKNEVYEAEVQVLKINVIETKCPICGETYSAAARWVANKEFCCEECQNDLKEIVLERRSIRNQIVHTSDSCDPGFYIAKDLKCDCCGSKIDDGLETQISFTGNATHTWRTVSLCPDCVYKDHKETVAVGTKAFICDKCNEDHPIDQLHVLQGSNLHLCEDCYSESIENDAEHMEDPQDESYIVETVRGDEIESCFCCKKKFKKDYMINRYDGYWCSSCYHREIDNPLTFEHRGFSIGDTVKHFKGGLYMIIERALNSEDSSKYNVIYKSLDTGTVWSRDEHMFCEEVERDGKRFYRFEKVNN